MRIGTDQAYPDIKHPPASHRGGSSTPLVIFAPYVVPDRPIDIGRGWTLSAVADLGRGTPAWGDLPERFLDHRGKAIPDVAVLYKHTLGIGSPATPLDELWLASRVISFMVLDATLRPTGPTMVGSDENAKLYPFALGPGGFVATFRGSWATTTSTEDLSKPDWGISGPRGAQPQQGPVLLDGERGRAMHDALYSAPVANPEFRRAVELFCLSCSNAEEFPPRTQIRDIYNAFERLHTKANEETPQRKVLVKRLPGPMKALADRVRRSGELALELDGSQAVVDAWRYAFAGWAWRPSTETSAFDYDSTGTHRPSVAREPLGHWLEHLKDYRNSIEHEAEVRVWEYSVPGSPYNGDYLAVARLVMLQSLTAILATHQAGSTDLWYDEGARQIRRAVRAAM